MAHPPLDAGGTLLARLEAPTAERTTRLAIFGDTHVAARATGTDRQFEHTERRLRQVVADVNARDVDVVAGVGDLTKDGEPWNVDLVADVLDDLTAPYVTIPGNHDVAASDTDDQVSLETFVERFPPGRLPFHERHAGVDLIGLNSVAPDKLVDEEQREWLDETLSDASTPIVLVHHNLPAFTAQLAAFRQAAGEDASPPAAIENAAAVADVLAAHDAPVVFTGHRHRPGLATYRGVTEIATAATCVYPQSYLLATIDDRGTTIRHVPLLSREAAEASFAVQREQGNPSKAALAAIHLANLPLREDWRPDG